MAKPKWENQVCFRRSHQLSEGRSKRWEEWECWGQEQSETQNQTEKSYLPFALVKISGLLHLPRPSEALACLLSVPSIYPSINSSNNSSVSHSIMSDTSATPWTVARFLCPWDSPGQSGLPFPSPGDLPNPRIKPRSLALQADSLSSELQGRSQSINAYWKSTTWHFSRPCGNSNEHSSGTKDKIYATVI